MKLIKNLNKKCKKMDMWDIGAIKWSSLLVGAIVGAYIATFVKQYLVWFIVIAVALAIKPIVKFLKN